MRRSWESEKLGNVIKFVGGGTPSKAVAEYWGGDVPWASVKDVKGGRLYFTQDRITELGVANSSTNIAEKDELLLVTRMSPGVTAITDIRTAVNQDIKIVRPISKISVRYLHYYFKSIKDKIDNLSAGSTVKGISVEKLNNLYIHFPNFEEQEIIADVLDKAQLLVKKRKEVIVKLDELIQSVFLDMFGDPSNNEKGFPKGKIKDLILEAKYGTSKKANENEGSFPYLRMNNLTYNGYMDFSNLKYIDLDEKEQDKYLVQEGDLLFNRTNSKELVGKTAVFGEKEPMAIAGYLIRVKGNELGNPYYISSYLNSKHGKMILQNMCKNIVGMANINAKEMQNIDILIPPKVLQDKYEEQYKGILKKKYVMNRQLEQLEVNSQSILQKAFKGELKVNTEIKA